MAYGVSKDLAKENPVAYVSGLISKATEHYSYLDTETARAIRYYLGDQYTMLDGRSKQAWVPPPVEGEIRYTGNRYAGVIDKKVAKLTEARSVPRVVPRTASAVDVRKAKTGGRIANWTWDITDCRDKLPDWVWWLLVAPRGWLYVSWDARAGSKIPQPMMSVDVETGQPTGAPLIDPVTGQPKVDYLPEGLPRVDVVSWPEMVWDPLATWEGDAEWCIRSTVEYCSKVKGVYGVEVKPSKLDTGNRVWQGRAVQFARGLEAPDIGATPDMQMCVVRRFWRVPCDDYPDGRLLITTDNEELSDGPNPYKHKMLPFAGACERRVGKSMAGYPVAWRLFDPQDEMNVRRSQLMEHCDKASNPPFIIGVGSGFEPADIDGMTGPIFQTMPGEVEPHYAGPGQLSPDVYKDYELAEQSFVKIAEMDILSSQMAPDASRAAIMQRIEEDESVLGTTRVNVASALRRAYKLLLLTTKQYVPDDRVGRIVGADGTAESIRISGKDIDFDVDVSVELESHTQMSKAARDAAIASILPIIQETNPQSVPDLVRSMQVSGTERIFEQGQDDINLAERQIARIKETMQPEPPLPFENLQKSVEVLQSVLKQEWELLEEGQAMALTQTLKLKSDELAMQQQQAMMQQAQQAAIMAQTKGTTAAAFGGGGPEKGSPPNQERQERGNGNG